MTEKSIDLQGEDLEASLKAARELISSRFRDEAALLIVTELEAFQEAVKDLSQIQVDGHRAGMITALTWVNDILDGVISGRMGPAEIQGRQLADQKDLCDRILAKIEALSRRSNSP